MMKLCSMGVFTLYFSAKYWLVMAVPQIHKDSIWPRAMVFKISLGKKKELGVKVYFILLVPVMSIEKKT